MLYPSRCLLPLSTIVQYNRSNKPNGLIEQYFLNRTKNTSTTQFWITLSDKNYFASLISFESISYTLYIAKKETTYIDIGSQSSSSHIDFSIIGY
ncbi:hypothetical protein [Carnobacterium sp.]|uniref:hypothetical protein n=1 Tax=Carnobacterium sp. TaxID=48221 RepID=UPI00388F3D54